MNIVKTVQAVRDVTTVWKRAGLRVGLVPTMGYLHEGHASLIRRAVTECDKVVVSIFVNPTQFGPNEDLDSYPRDMEHDTALCEDLGAAMIFNPEPEEMYPQGSSTFVEVQGLNEHLCGRNRPTHFRGVCTVVNKLFTIVAPHAAYFGQKDAQQFAILSRMVRDLNMDIKMVGCPIVREEDGLAKSSRNAYLSPDERQAALVLSKALNMGKSLLEQGEAESATVIQQMCAMIATEPLARIDYVEIVDGATLSPLETVNRPVLVALAVQIGKTRLIDNFFYAPEVIQ